MIDCLINSSIQAIFPTLISTLSFYIGWKYGDTLFIKLRKLLT